VDKNAIGDQTAEDEVRRPVTVQIDRKHLPFMSSTARVNSYVPKVETPGPDMYFRKDVI